MKGAQVGVLEKRNQVGLGGFLEGKNGHRLESKIFLEILGNLTDKTLERHLADEKIGTPPVLTDLAQGDGSGSEPVGVLESVASP